MRGLPARRVASSVLCATVLIGIAGPAAVAADNDSARKHVHAASSAPVPNADALLAQVKSLGDVGGVLTPVTDLLTQALKADNGQLSADKAKSLGDAVTAAIAKITAAAPAAPAVPATPAAPAVPAVPALPSPKSADDSKAKAPADLAGDALASLQKAVATLLAAVTSGNVAGVVPAVTGVVTGLVNVVAATLLGSGLPAPSLPGLPALPSLPSTSSLPAVPSVPGV
ncbi:hypothetical protein ABTY96_27570 [Streptomyces sp. NPDC096057]|uniref:hypothetical protein n=1 Tax=Streptomyces sp. NPDC096057 TaxID=3155543 RepID=UPI003317EF91